MGLDELGLGTIGLGRGLGTLGLGTFGLGRRRCLGAVCVCDAKAGLRVWVWDDWAWNARAWDDEGVLGCLRFCRKVGLWSLGLGLGPQNGVVINVLNI